MTRRNQYYFGQDRRWSTKMNKLNIVDMFCGGGGESTGLIEAAHDYNFDINMSAINHWERAIETHSQNYPFAEHRCENVQHIEPNTLAASKSCDLMWQRNAMTCS